MGLQSDIQSDLAAAMAGDLADTVEAFTATRVTPGGTYDPASGTYTDQTTETWSADWIRDTWTRQELDSQHIDGTDIKRIVLQSTTAWHPQPGDTVGAYRVVDAQQDGAAATWTVQLRRAS